MATPPVPLVQQSSQQVTIPLEVCLNIYSCVCEVSRKQPYGETCLLWNQVTLTQSFVAISLNYVPVSIFPSPHTQFTDAILGPNGSRLAGIKAQSSCEITLNPPTPGTSERIISIMGSSQGIQIAQQLMQNRWAALIVVMVWVLASSWCPEIYCKNRFSAHSYFPSLNTHSVRQYHPNVWASPPILTLM